MIMGAAGPTVWYNLKLRHPTLDMPIIDYDLALLFQPMLMLCINIGVVFNVIFCRLDGLNFPYYPFHWNIDKGLLKGYRYMEERDHLQEGGSNEKESDGRDEVEYKALPSGPRAASKTLRIEVPIIENVRWTELGLLCFVWVSFLILQVLKQYYTSTCSLFYWILNFLQDMKLFVCTKEGE